jgi:hypothetical protein
MGLILRHVQNSELQQLLAMRHVRQTVLHLQINDSQHGAFPVEILMFAQLVKLFHAVYGNDKFITVSTRAHHWTVYTTEADKSSPHCQALIL